MSPQLNEASCARTPKATAHLAIWWAVVALAIAWPWVLFRAVETCVLEPVGPMALHREHLPGETEAEWRYELRNRSSGDIVLSKVASSCTCISVELAPHTVKPGENCVILAKSVTPFRGISDGWFVVCGRDGDGRDLGRRLLSFSGTVKSRVGLQVAPDRCWLMNHDGEDWIVPISVRLVLAPGASTPRGKLDEAIAFDDVRVRVSVASDWRAPPGGDERVGEFTALVPRELGIKQGYTLGFRFRGFEEYPGKVELLIP